MICQICKLDRSVKDFLGKEICYKCVWNQKNTKVTELIPEKLCKICEKPLSSVKWKYCGQECADKGKNKSRWHHHVRCEKIRFNKYEVDKRLNPTKYGKIEHEA